MISTIFEFLTRILVWVIKSIFGLVAFILRQFSRLIRLLYASLPVTGLLFSLFYIYMAVSLFGGGDVLPKLPVAVDTASFSGSIIKIARSYLTLMSSYDKTLMYFVLFFLMLILILPMLLLLLGFGVVGFCIKYLAIGLIVDAFVYLFMLIITGKTLGQIFLSRYKVLFPRIGHKLDEHSYHQWMRKRKYEAEADPYRSRRREPEDFYDDEYDDEYEGYDEDYDDEVDYIEEYEDDVDFIEEYDEEDFEDEDDYIEDKSFFHRSRRRYSRDDYYEDEPEDDYEEEESSRTSSRQRTSSTSSPIGNFNFFAGCTTRESADKKYKSLVKLYHPDNMDGDTAAIQEINAQYSEIKKTLN